jgi:hypothetical protein
MDDAAKKLQKSENLIILNKSPFKHMGHGMRKNINGFKRSAFKNFK